MLNDIGCLLVGVRADQDFLRAGWPPSFRPFSTALVLVTAGSIVTTISGFFGSIFAPAIPGILFNTPRTVATHPPQEGAVSRTSWISVVVAVDCSVLQPANISMSAALERVSFFIVDSGWGKCVRGDRIGCR